MNYSINPNMTYLKYADCPHYTYEIHYIDKRICYTNDSLQTLINKVLLLEGANLQSRIKYAKTILKIHKLLPILVVSSEDFILFPTTSKNDFSFKLINAKQVAFIDCIQSKTEIHFNNHTSIIIHNNFHTICRKMGESLQLKHFQKHYIKSILTK